MRRNHPSVSRDERLPHEHITAAHAIGVPADERAAFPHLIHARNPKTEVMTLAEVSAAVGYSTKTIHRHRAQGLLVGYRSGPGGHWRFTRIALATYIRRLEQNGTDSFETETLDSFITSTITPSNRARSP